MGPLKGLQRLHFEDTKTLQNTVQQWLRYKSSDVYTAEIYACVKVGKKIIQNAGDYIEK